MAVTGLSSWSPGAAWSALLLRLPRSWTQTLAAGWGQCRDALPPRIRAALQSSAVERTLLPVEGRWKLIAADGIEVLDSWDAQLAPELQRERVELALGSVDREDRRLWLGLPATSGLVRRLGLPLAARRALHRIAHYEMDRQTPFRPEQVYHDIREVPGTAVAPLLAVRLAVAPRVLVDIHLRHLAELGLAMDGIDLMADRGRLGFNLLPAGERPRHRQAQRRLHGRLGLGLAVLSLIAAWQWQHNRHAALEDMRAQIASQEVQLARLAELQRQWQTRQQAAGFLARHRQHAVQVVDVLEELSRLLPDDTVVQRLSIDADGRLTFLGLAPQAAHLIDVLKPARQFGEPGFQGTIVRDPVSGKERFSMTAQCRVRGGEAHG